MAAIDNPQDRYNYIRQGALQRGIDPSLVDRLVRSEGGYKTFDLTGDSGRSFGPFQDYTGGGLGNQMRAQGLEPSDPRSETQNIDWNLNYIAEHGASPNVWHGLRRGGGGGSLPPEGEYGGATHINVTPTEQNGLSPGGALLLSSLLQNSRQEERQQDTGNSLLNMILSQQGSPREQIPQQHPSEQRIEPPAAPTPPATVPELQQQQLPTPVAPQPLPTGPTPPMPGQSSTPAPSAPTAPVMPAATPAAPQPVPSTPAPAPAAAAPPPASGTGNGLLDRLLHGIIAGTRAGGPVLGPAMRALTTPGAPEKADDFLHAAVRGLGLPSIEEQEKSDAEFHKRFAEGQPLSQIAREMELSPIAGAVGTEPVGEAGLPVPRPTPGAELTMAPRQPGIPSPAVAGREVAVPGRELIPQPGTGGGAGMGGGEPPIFRGGMAETAPERPGRSKNEGESKEVRDMRLQAMHSTQDKLFRLWTQATAYTNKVLRQFRDMPQLTAEQKLQAERYLEWQPGMPQIAIDGPTRAIVEKVIKPAQRAAAKDWAWLKTKGAIEHVPDDIADELSEGYLHRMRAPQGYERHPFSPFAGVKSLRRGYSSQKHRQFYVVQDARGNRTLYRGEAPPPNTALHDAAGNKIGEVRRATTEEIEQATDTRYVHDPVMASLQNMTQLHLARKNVELLTKDILPELTDAGLAVTDRTAANRLGFKGTDVPALQGHYFEPRLADAFNDFMRTPSLLHEDMEGMLGVYGKINRTAINALFLNPFGHIWNEISDMSLARGHLWFSPMAYPDFVQTTRAAWTDVTKRTPFYYKVMDAGGSTMGAGFENGMLLHTLANRVRDEMTRLPNMDAVARETGIWKTGKEMGQAIWNASQKFMWGDHDLWLVQGVRERMLRNPKMTIEQAVKDTERFLADYRVPATIGEGGKVINLPRPTARALSRLMQDRTVTVFGRYRFDKLKAIGNTLRDASRALSRSGMSTPQRVEALGRLGWMLIWSTILQYGLTAGLQAWTGNSHARVRIPGAMGLPGNMARVAQDAMRGDLGQAGYDFWMSLFSVITPMPAIMEVAAQAFDRPYSGSGSTITRRGAPPAENLARRGVHAAKTLLPPLGDVMDPSHLIGSLLPVSIPAPHR